MIINEIFELHKRKAFICWNVFFQTPSQYFCLLLILCYVINCTFISALLKQHHEFSSVQTQKKNFLKEGRQIFFQNKYIYNSDVLKVRDVKEVLCVCVDSFIASESVYQAAWGTRLKYWSQSGILCSFENSLFQQQFKEEEEISKIYQTHIHNCEVSHSCW